MLVFFVGDRFEYLLIYNISYLIIILDSKLGDLLIYMRKYLIFLNV